MNVMSDIRFNLNEIYERHIINADFFPLDIAICIAMNTCEIGDGKIITPDNLLIAKNGNVSIETSLIDKEKCVPFLPPEYLREKNYDDISSQYSLAVILWELLAGRRLFKTSSKKLTVQKILNSRPEKPSKYNNNITKEIDEIILKALSKNREDRFDSTEHFSRELSKNLYLLYPRFYPTDLKYFINFLFNENERVVNTINLNQKPKLITKKIKVKKKKQGLLEKLNLHF